MCDLESQTRDQRQSDEDQVREGGLPEPEQCGAAVSPAHQPPQDRQDPVLVVLRLLKVLRGSTPKGEAGHTKP
ncbi:hypothetical protein GCM10010252_11820 [Streptomyces aureoverticillatus]|nr:hypothetical protein GCM10010252_11820 [Streptomyces aureoverticillatus]